MTVKKLKQLANELPDSDSQKKALVRYANELEKRQQNIEIAIAKAIEWVEETK